MRRLELTQHERDYYNQTNTSFNQSSKHNLKRDDPQIKYILLVNGIRQRLDNLVKSASIYKTKACGVLRKTPNKGLTQTNL